MSTMPATADHCTPLAAAVLREAPRSAFQRRMQQSQGGCGHFLHEQCTADVQAMEAEGFCEQAAFCNRKGEVVADAWAVPPQLCPPLPPLPDQPDLQPGQQPGWLLLTDATVLQPLLDLLRPQAMLAGVEAVPLPQLQLHFLPSADAQQGDIALRRLRDGALRLETRDTTAVEAKPPPKIAQAGSPQTARWDRWLAERGRVMLCGATGGGFRPHDLGYQHGPVVDFHKGCYPGQEIVARTQHLGKLKKDCRLWEPVACAPLPDLGGQVQTEGGQTLQVLGRCAGEPSLVLALTPLAADPGQGETLRLAQGGAWRRLPLPWEGGG